MRFQSEKVDQGAELEDAFVGFKVPEHMIYNRKILEIDVLYQ